MLAWAEEGRYMRGPGWRGLWLGKPDAFHPQLIDSISDVYARVVDRVRADLDIPAHRNYMLFVICDDTSRGVDAMLDLVVGKKARETLPPCGAGLAWGDRVFVSAPAASENFRPVLAHELCHAWCGAEFDPIRSFPWLDEGYAELVAREVCSDDPELLERDLWFLRSLIETRQRLSIPELFSTRELRSRYSGQAVAFVSYLRSLREQSPTIWEFVKEALAGRMPSADAAVDRLLAATGMSLPRIEEGFYLFCSQAAERIDRRYDHVRAVQLRTERSQN